MVTNSAVCQIPLITSPVDNPSGAKLAHPGNPPITKSDSPSLRVVSSSWEPDRGEQNLLKVRIFMSGFSCFQHIEVQHGRPAKISDFYHNCNDVKAVVRA
jgi:hypothetical protein